MMPRLSAAEYPFGVVIDERHTITMLDRLLDIIRDIPLGTLIFIAALLWSFLGRGGRETPAETRPQRAEVPPPEPSTYASDERRAREEFDQFGGLEFGTPEDRYGDANQWGQTTYGFEPTEWGSTFDDRDDEPRIHR